MRDELDKPLFTVFTPTFNRAYTLPRVFESLKRQTYRNFEWVIVDDGSTDETHKVVEAWQNEADFCIRYFWQPNRGKHVAFNRGVELAHGKFFLPIDSDDACLPIALERFKYHWDSIPFEEQNFFTGVCALCQDQTGELIGTTFPFPVIDSNTLAIRYRYKVTGDKWGFQRAEVLRNHPFPEIDGERFIPEGVVWNAIGKTYKIRYVNEILNICFIQRSHNSDQLTHALLKPQKYAKGCHFYYKSVLKNHFEWFLCSPVEFYRMAIHYVRFHLHSGFKLIHMLSGINSHLPKILILLASPIGYLIFLFEKRDILIIKKLKSLCGI